MADDIDPNLQDASLVIANLDWILAELVRLHHQVTANEATKIIESLVVRRVPIIENFDGFLKVLNPLLQVRGYILVLLYERDKSGAEYVDLESE